MTPTSGSSGAPVRPVHDALDFFVPPHRAEPPSERRALEVHQLWGSVLLQTRHVVPTVSDHVTIGATTGWRWSLLGVDIGWVSEGWRRVLPALPPMWSEVQCVPRSDFPVAQGTLDDDDEHRLFDFDGAQWSASARDGWRVWVLESGDWRSVDERTVPVTAGRQVVVDTGTVAFVARVVPEGRRIPERHTGKTEWGFLSTLAFLAFLGVLFGLGVTVLPQPPGVTVAEIRDKWAHVIIAPPPKPKVVVAPEPDRDPDPGGGAKTRDDRSKKVRIAVDGHPQMTDAGILGQLDSLLRPSIVDGLADQIGLIGVRGGPPGGGGLGSRGGAFGSGGGAESIGGLGQGLGPGYGDGGGDWGKRSAGIAAVADDALILGSLDKRLVDEVIQRHLQAIRYCYQRELPTRPDLGGAVSVKFTIARDGTVAEASIQRSALGVPRAEECILTRFRRMTFPKPMGGGIVIVRYPLVFSTR